MAIAIVTTAKGIDTYDGTTGTTQATASWNLTTTNRLIVVGIRWASSASGISISSVADTAGNTYVDSGVGRLTLASSVGYMQMYYCKATTATSASNVVTVTFSSATDYKSVIAAEYSGADTTAPLDVTASGTNASATSVTSGSFTPTRSGEVAVAFAAHGPAETDVISAGTSYTARSVTQANGGDHLFLEDRLLAPQSSQTAGASNGGASFWWGTIVATFKTAGFSLIGAGSAATGTTASYDTRGANLIVVGTIQDTSAQSFTNSTSDAASYTGLTGQDAGGGLDTYAKLWYLYNPTTSATHTFTSAVSYGGIFVLAFSGAMTPPFDVQNGATSASTTSLAAGSITPTLANEVVVLFTGVNPTGSSTVYTVSGGGFSAVQLSVNGLTLTNYGAAMSYLVQTTAVATNPAHGWTGTGKAASVIASFKELTSGGSSGAPSDTLMGQACF